MHNNETHLLMCTVPWSHVTMKWMTGFLWHGSYRSKVSRAEAVEQVKTVYMDELLLRQAQTAASQSSLEFDGFIVGGGATDSGYSSYAHQTSFLLLLMVLNEPGNVQFEEQLPFFGNSFFFCAQPLLATTNGHSPS